MLFVLPDVLVTEIDDQRPPEIAIHVSIYAQEHQLPVFSLRMSEKTFPVGGVGELSTFIFYASVEEILSEAILKFEDKHGGATKSLEEARPEIEKKLLQKEAQELQERWLASLREKAYIKTF